MLTFGGIARNVHLEGPSYSVDITIIIHKTIENSTIILSIINPSLFILLKFSYILIFFMNFLAPNFKPKKINLKKLTIY